MLSLNLDMLEEPTLLVVFFFQAEDGIRDTSVTGVQTCALPISGGTTTTATATMAMTGGATTMAGAPKPIVKSERENIGRNDPCWCGSGKKFKKCHGA